MMNKSFVKVAFYLFSALLIVYFVFKVVPSVISPSGVDVEIVEEYTYDNFESVQGIAMRNEVVLQADNVFGNVSYTVPNGDRIAKDEPVARYSSSELTSDEKNSLFILNRTIDQINSSLEGTALSDAKSLENSVKSAVYDYLDVLDSGNYSLSAIDNVQEAFNKKDILVNGESKYVNLLESCEKEKKEILKNSLDAEKTLTAPVGGYFTTAYDGYEDIVATDNLNMSVEDFFNITETLSKTKPDRYIGKLQNEPVWYFAAIVDSKIAENFAINQSVDLEFNLSAAKNKKITSSVQNKSQSKDGKIVVTFRCSILTQSEFLLRKETCKIILNTYTGLKVSNDALRVVDGISGVYAVVGQRIVFKPITLIYSADNFSIVRPDNQRNSKTLTPNDEVVLGGKDLFDGKVVGIG